mmetsp:Transcript_1614/g.1548  ORF Transcript_1614/g.1548 Transcript_1614/m.1548 type:complete len:80 (+) Transcript_1614:735-974(+)
MSLRKLNIPSMTVATYDIFVEGILPDLENVEIPSIYLFPGDGKAKKRFKVGDEVNVQELMLFAEKNAVFKFKLSQQQNV